MMRKFSALFFLLFATCAVSNAQSLFVATPPAGLNTQIQFNDAGAFKADGQFTWDKNNKLLNIGIPFDDPSFDSNFFIQPGIGENIAKILDTAGQTIFDNALSIKYQTDGYASGLAIMTMSTDPTATTAVSAMNIDATYNSAASGGRISVIDAAMGNFGSGLVSDAAIFLADGLVASGPITNSIGFRATNMGQAGVTNSYGLLVDDQSGATNNWAIKTGLGKVDFGDFFTTHANAAPADGSVSAGEIAFWFDKTNGASKLMLKAKQADGTVETSSVPLAGAVGAFATLATCAAGTEGNARGVTDSSTNTWGATITGGGANHVLAYCDGTNWTVAAK